MGRNLAELRGVALVFEEHRQDVLGQGAGAEDGYCGGMLLVMVSHLIAVAPWVRSSCGAAFPSKIQIGSGLLGPDPRWLWVCSTFFSLLGELEVCLLRGEAVCVPYR